MHRTGEGRRHRRPLIAAAVAVTGLVLAMVSAVGVAAPATAAECGAACQGVSSDPRTLANELMAAHAKGKLTEATISSGSLFASEIGRIADGSIGSYPQCNIDTRILQTLVVASRAFRTIELTDLNRNCANDGVHTCQSNAASNHCAQPAIAVDIDRVDGAKLDGGNAATVAFLRFVDTFLPPNMRVGQRNCRGSSLPAMGMPNLSAEFSDSCDHIHLDFRATGGAGLRVSGGGAATAPTAPAVAVQANTGSLWTWAGTAGTVGLGRTALLGMKPGTSPAITRLSNGSYAVAFVANDGALWTWTGAPGTTGFGTSARVGVAANTSPSITANGTTAVVAFQANTGDLWTWSGAPGTLGLARDAGVGMKSRTSPSVAMNGSTAMVAFQANTGSLWTWTGAPATTGFAASAHLGMNPAASPTIAASGGTAAVAFQANTNELWTWKGAPASVGFGASTSLGMAPGQRPSATYVGGAFAVAFAANTSQLWTWTGAPGTWGLGRTASLGMMPGTSPSASSDGGRLAVAFQANTGSLWTWTGAPATWGFGTSAHLGLAAATSPSYG